MFANEEESGRERLTTMNDEEEGASGREDTSLKDDCAVNLGLQIRTAVK